MHQRVVGAIGSGKTRLAARVLCWHDFQVGIGTVGFDPSRRLGSELIDVILRLPKREQRRLRVRERLIVLDLGGLDGYVHDAFPLLYRRGDESLYQIAQRPIETWLRVDPDLSRNPTIGANALKRFGSYLFMLCAAMEPMGQAPEAADILANPRAWAGPIRRLRAANSRELTEAADFFLDVYPNLREQERHFRVGALEAKLAPFVLDPHLRAMYGSSAPPFDWTRVAPEGLFVIVDTSRIESPEQRKFALLWLYRSLIDHIVVERGPGKAHPPLSVVLDELPAFLDEPGKENGLLTQDFQTLAEQHARQTQTWLTVIHQRFDQLNPRIQRILWDCIQYIGPVGDLEEAMQVARRFDRWDPDWVRKEREIWHPPTMFTESWSETVTDEFNREDQVYLHAQKYLTTPTLHFWLGTTEREGKLPTRLQRINLAGYHQDQYVREDLDREVRLRLMARIGRPRDDVLEEIAARAQAARATVERATPGPHEGTRPIAQPTGARPVSNDPAARQTTVSPSPATAHATPVIPLTHDGYIGDIAPEGDDTPLHDDALLTNLPPVTQHGAVPPLRRRARATQLPTQPGLGGAGESERKR